MLSGTCCVQLEELSISGEQSNDNWHVGMDCIPDEWAALTSLTKLELRGHSLLNVSTAVRVYAALCCFAR